MEGYGDLRQNEEQTWMELFGSFSYSGTFLESDWLNEEASISVRKSLDMETEILQVNGGMSRYSGLPEGVAGVTLDNVELDTSVDCTVVGGKFSVLGSQGERILFTMAENSSCEGCSTVEIQGQQQEMCWDLRQFTEESLW